MGNTRLKLGLAALTITGVVIGFLVIRQWQTRLTDENALLRQQLAQAQATIESLSNLVLQAKAPEPPASRPSDELLRLRGEVSLLRQQTNELTQRQQNGRLRFLVGEESQPTNQISPEERFVLQQTHVVDAMTAILTAVDDYASKHNGKFPDNLEDLLVSGSLQNSNFAGNLRLEDFELPLHPVNNETVVRARKAVQRPDGAFVIMSGGFDAEGHVRTEIRNWNQQ